MTSVMDGVALVMDGSALMASADLGSHKIAMPAALLGASLIGGFVKDPKAVAVLSAAAGATAHCVAEKGLQGGLASPGRLVFCMGAAVAVGLIVSAMRSKFVEQEETRKLMAQGVTISARTIS